jgi:hypothetical protein
MKACLISIIFLTKFLAFPGTDRAGTLRYFLSVVKQTGTTYGLQKYGI